MGAPVDVVVIGAGLAGLNAAWESQKRGASVAVLDARDRVGGRAATVNEPYNGVDSHFDEGAHFIGDERYQARIWELCKYLGVEVFAQYDGPDTPSWTPGSTLPYWAGKGANLQWDGSKFEAYIGGTIPPTTAGQHYMAYLEQLSESVPLSNVARMPQAKEYDALSVWDWVTTINLPGLGPAPDSFKALTRMLCRVGFSTEPENINMLWMLFYIKSSGGLRTFQALRWPVQGAQGYRVKDGAQAIATAVADQLLETDPSCLHFNAEVVSVADNGTDVTVETKSAGSFVGKQVLVAMAPLLCEKITFTPPLSQGRIDATANMPNSYMIMAYVTFDDAFWRTNTTSYPNGTVNGIPTNDISRYGLSGDALFVDGPVVWTMDNTSAEGQPALFAFLVGDEGRKLGGEPLETRKAAVLDVLTSAFGADVGTHNPVYHEKNWNLDPFSQGCPASHFKPGGFLDSYEHVLLSGLGPKPHGNVHFASTEAATISNGYMDGAVWAGQEVAAHILAALGKTAGATPSLARELEMEWCVRTIFSAIEAQDPMMEWPALSTDVVFHPPGGQALGGGPYLGQMGTVAFYERLGTYISLTSVNLEAITIDAVSNTAYATWTNAGIVNTTGTPFRDVKAGMLFKFSDPASPDVVIVEDWLMMDVELVDAMVGAMVGGQAVALPAPPSTASSTSSLLHPAEALTHVEAAKVPGLTIGPRTLIYGPGGAQWPTGPFQGPAGADEFQRYASAVDITSLSVTNVAIDLDSLTINMSLDIAGTGKSGTSYSQPLLIVGRIANGSNPMTISEMHYLTDASSFN